MDDLYRLVYTSKNLLPGPEQTMAAAVVEILATSQRNNSAVDVTGALMFNGRAFAQVLEGPRRAVEAIFERIQRDERHGDVTVLQCGAIDVRGFENWSMAFVGQSSHGQSLWQELAGKSGFDVSRLDGDAVFEMLRGLLIEEEGAHVLIRGSTGVGPVAAAASRKAAVDPLRFDQIREEIAEIGPRALKDGVLSGPYAAAAPSRGDMIAKQQAPAGPLDVLRLALRAERQLTTELKDVIDDLRLSLAVKTDDLRVLQAERDKWMSRAGALAHLIAKEAQPASLVDHSSTVQVTAALISNRLLKNAAGIEAAS